MPHRKMANVCGVQGRGVGERGAGYWREAYAEVGVPKRAYVNFFIVVASN